MIGAHLRRHSVTIKEYYEKYVATNNKEDKAGSTSEPSSKKADTKKVPTPTKVAEAKKLLLAAYRPIAAASPHKKPAAPADAAVASCDSLEVMKWANSSITLHCKICSVFETKKAFEFHQHLLKVHDIGSIGKYNKLPGRKFCIVNCQLFFSFSRNKIT